MTQNPFEPTQVTISESEPTESYKAVVERIKNLEWEKLQPEQLQQLMYLSYISAHEFAASLRVALELYPENTELQEMAAGELHTDNIPYEDYTEPGDHDAYLAHFLGKAEIAIDPKLQQYGQAYLNAVAALPDELRAMSIFSREEELSGIFRRILTASDWSAPGLPAFQHYLERHIALDSDEGGHHDLTKNMPVDERLKKFYDARLEMYKAIPELFSEAQ